MADRRGEKVTAEIDRQVEDRGYCTVPDVLIGIGMLESMKYNEWKKGNVFCLEDVCSSDLPRLHAVLKAVKAYAEETGLKPSINKYIREGKGSVPLRFTKSGDPVRERLYSTHYLDPWKAQDIRRRK